MTIQAQHPGILGSPGTSHSDVHVCDEVEVAWSAWSAWIYHPFSYFFLNFFSLNFLNKNAHRYLAIDSKKYAISRAVWAFPGGLR